MGRVGGGRFSPAWLAPIRISMVRLAQSQVLVERVLTAAVLVGLVFVTEHYVALGHLPRPFHSDPSQSLMDLYNTAYWANRPGAYGVWHTVYPPLPLLFTRLITAHVCYLQTAYIARRCDPGAVLFIFAFYILNIFLVYASLRKAKAQTAAPRTLALCLGLPMLYGLELANLIIPCFTFFVLAEGGLLRPVWARQLCRGLAFNFKLYLFVSILPSVLRLRIRWLIGVGAAFIVVYIITLLIYQSGTPAELIADLINYAHSQSNLYIEQNHLAAISARSNGFWNRIFPAILRIGELIALAGILAGVLSKEPVSRRRLSALSLSLVCSEAAIHTQGFSADYTQIFLTFLIFVDAPRGASAYFLIVIAYMLCVSVDFSLLHAQSSQIESYFSGKTVNVNFDLTISQFVRPLLIVFIQVGLTRLIWRDAVFKRTEIVSTCDYNIVL